MIRDDPKLNPMDFMLDHLNINSKKSLWLAYGVGRFTQANASIGELIKYGITENQLFDISQNFIIPLLRKLKQPNKR